MSCSGALLPEPFQQHEIGLPVERLRAAKSARGTMRDGEDATLSRLAKVIPIGVSTNRLDSPVVCQSRRAARDINPARFHGAP
jgi:hypothetical protein